MNDYKSAFNAAAADLGAIIALLGFTKYPGVDPVLRAITDLMLEKAENQVLREERDAAQARVEELGAKLGAALELLRESRGFVDRDNPLNESGQIKLLEEIDVFLTSPIAQAQHSVPEGVTIERDVAGTIHIKVGDFDFIQLQYQRPYTDNASTWKLAERIASLLAAAPGKEVGHE
ncbi:hypothetical protein [Pseudomonas aeruginosa]|uniref:hypothetical protein n=1 Tax=Pseudomonas aeruginosa TaxID=287 RepID=UPI000AF08EE2|nr:hypothetical protein [Pseudomonas aeruginosa]